MTRRKLYQDGRHEENSHGGNAFGAWNRAWLEDGLEWNALEACQEAGCACQPRSLVQGNAIQYVHVDDEDSRVEPARNVDGHAEPALGREAHVKEKKGRFDDPVNTVIDDFFNKQPLCPFSA